jgi:hypothetical protein
VVLLGLFFYAIILIATTSDQGLLSIMLRLVGRSKGCASCRKRRIKVSPSLDSLYCAPYPPNPTAAILSSSVTAINCYCSAMRFPRSVLNALYHRSHALAQSSGVSSLTCQTISRSTVNLRETAKNDQKRGIGRQFL